MGKTKKDKNARVAGRRKQTKESAAGKCAWIMFRWISMCLTIHRYRTQKKSHCKYHGYRCQIPKFLHNLSFLLTRSFCLLDTIAIASSARPIFTSSLQDVFSFVLRCFRFFELVHRVFRGPCLLIT